MARPRHESRQERVTRFEEFEQRLVMSAQAVASILPELEIAAPAMTQQVVSHPLINTTSPTTEAAGIAEQYGFDGAGQTVAVIDSGIAWDHYALGGGFGEGNKVVGGWDFAENDANPYDDGPAGFHGTHVAGIIGSTDEQYQGVSSGVDLVALRVFDDSSGGDLKWVEEALQWVHDHKDDFENPITTVNLSLGTEWNAFNTPEWATLEEEFAQLEADGLFISVAAGNSFHTYGEAGLSYPAVSDHVVPVASHGSDGGISDFSQRVDGILSAPGESIKSTVPDHLFGGTSAGSFLGSTGTSMAAPYVAGASAILRQANEFMGVTGIDQEMLYDQFMETADRVYDSVTGGYHYQINLEAALESVIHDQHADAAGSATDLGAIRNGQAILGTIGKLTDVDQFKFNATANGEVTLSFDSNQNMSALVEVVGSTATFDGNKLTFSVEAGKEYNFAIAASNGNGQYRVDIGFIGDGVSGGISNGNSGGSQGSQTGSGTTTNWGAVVSNDFLNQSVSGESMFELTASRDGILTVQSDTGSNESLQLEIYDSQMNRVGVQNGSTTRLDVIAQEGETFFVKASGTASSVDFQVDNLVSLSNGNLIVNGSNLDDSISIDATDGFSIDINGIGYHFDANQVQEVSVRGHGGNDSIDLQLGVHDDSVGTRVDGVYAGNSSFRLNASNFETVRVDGGGGYNTVSMADTADDDFLQAAAHSTTLSGEGYSSTASGFDIVYSKSTGGNDRVEIAGSNQDDLFVSNNERHTLHAQNSIVVAHQFSEISATGGGGNDRAIIFDTAGDDKFSLKPSFARVETDSFEITASGFETINAIGGRGHDTMMIEDSHLDEVFRSENNLTTLVGDDFMLVAHGFSNVHATSVGGYDVANIFDTAGNDQFSSTFESARIQSATGSVDVTGFDRVNAIAKHGGNDQAIMVGSNGDDIVISDGKSATLKSGTDMQRAVGFEEVEIDTRAGDDAAFLTGTLGNDKLTASYSDAEFETTLQLLQMVNTERTSFDGNGGIDEVVLDEMGNLDLLSSIGDKATAFLRDHTVSFEDIDLLEANTVDDAIADYDLEAVDYLYMLRGQWQKNSQNFMREMPQHILQYLVDLAVLSRTASHSSAAPVVDWQ